MTPHHDLSGMDRLSAHVVLTYTHRNQVAAVNHRHLADYDTGTWEWMGTLNDTMIHNLVHSGHVTTDTTVTLTPDGDTEALTATRLTLTPQGRALLDDINANPFQ
ncbi:hypothetical protein [Actinokineospora globicatena]|uniref:hypothetical protein n=1 Tax=Actinokineospora globicatena TaxID=103729 RepID=UPI0020A4A386|nr:hypothetical protein [Actinokineospora globicatena]MCP2306086.1 hypothetical protein [Actinokineospora globicatena]GLW80040.1 hypothetical protein Aglo01_45210 [Actinokineospora globicatena]GLW86869.1 hypothetical protein Aglo02_45080 [Actinokineospora globicatena]